MKAALLLAASFLCLLGGAAMAQGPYQQQPKPSAEDKVRLNKLAKAYDAAKSILAKSPKSEKAKKDFSEVGTAYGTECMMTPVLDRKVKYKMALHVYREVLKVDPAQPEAKKNSDMIVKIYKSLGRPVPSG